jgi:hypothetical protein
MLKKFILKIVILLVWIVIPAFIMEIFISSKLDDGYRYYFQGDWHDLKGHNSDILFVGNSRTWLHVDPFEIQDKYHVSAEIIAADGQDVHFVWEKFRQYTRGNKVPGELYLQFDPFFIYERDDLYGALNIQTCYFGGRVDISSLESRRGYIKMYKYLPMIAYQAGFVANVLTGDTISSSESFERTRGFQSRDWQWSGKWQHPENVRVDMNAVSPYIDSFINYAKQNKVYLYFMYPPQSQVSFEKSIRPELFQQKVNEYSSKHSYGIQFLDMNIPGLYNDSTIFYNHLHLNQVGVSKFMQQLIQDDRAFLRWR